MSADYEKIREENIARYGWDTAVLDLLGQLYSERTHFIFELIQNAEDAGATALAFELFSDRLELRHDGRPFTEADVRGVCGVGQSGKSADLTKIGQFGIGFKSVYAYTRTPHIYSGGEHFRIENYVRPYATDPLPRPAAGTVFVFPFDHDDVPAAVAVREISAALAAIEPGILLFLASITRLTVGGTGVAGSVIERSTESRTPASRRVRLAKGRGRPEEWLAWYRPVEGLAAGTHRVEIAFRAEAGRVVALDRSPLSVFFPTEKETFLGFIAQGPYRTTPARDNVPAHDPANQVLVRETAALLAGVLRELRDDGLLTAAALTALPLDATRFESGSMFRPLFEAVRAALAAEALIPADGGGYRPARQLKLAGGRDVRELADAGQLGALYGSPGPAWFADESITESGTPVLWRYLRDELGLEEVTAESLVTRLTAEFLQDQPDEWIARLYGLLSGYPRLWRAPDGSGGPGGPGGLARTKPVIRLEDGRQVAPFGADGRPAVYLPGPSPSSLPTVRRAVAGSPVARPFLDALGLTEPDVVAEVLELILPRYDGLDVAALDPAQHDADLERVVRALDEAGPARHDELLGRLRQTAFLIGENAATGEQRLLPPPALYQRGKDLEVYFDGNPGAWFAADSYGPWLVQLRGMGVRQAVEVRARTPDQLGYVTITVEFGRNERGLDGFDPDADIDGLGFALRHPSHARSEYVWNVLLAPNRRLVTGVVERSVLQSFGDSSREPASSAMGLAAGREAWLPGRDATFHRPAELSLDDLPPTYTRDEGLAHALGMMQPVVAEAARQLGVPAAVLWGLSGRPDLVALVERELGTGPAS